MAMLDRLKGFFSRFKRTQKVEEIEQDQGVSVPPEDEIPCAEVYDRCAKLAELLDPVHKNWAFIEDTLLWKNSLPACVCFFLISGVFWKFISMKLRRVALILGAFLLANGLSTDIRTFSWEFFHNNFNLQSKDQAKLQFNFEDLCLFLATGWAMSAQFYKSIKSLSTDCPPKFYCILAVSLFTVLTLFTYFPVLEFIYVSVCAIFFYPSMHYYGLLDRINSRLHRLTEPIFRHWENNRTKRRRVINLPASDKQQEEQQVYDSDDEFSLEKNQFTKEVLSSVVPDHDDHDDLKQSHDDHDDLKQSHNELLGHGEPSHDADFFTESHFEENLAMPSMSNFDSLMETYDDFHAGLKFSDYTDSSRTYDVLAAAANNLDTDEEIDELPYENDQYYVQNSGYQDGMPKKLSHPAADQELRLRQSRGIKDSLKPGNSDSKGDKDSDFSTETCTRAVEADFEFLDHADLEDPNYPKNNPQPDVGTENMTSYAESGIATVSKWLWYE